MTEAESGRARSILIVLTVIWGSTFVVLQTGVALVSPLVLIAVRFAVAGLTLALFKPAVLSGGLRLLGPALPLSLSILSGFFLQMSGIVTTTPARSAFITSLSVVIVPVLDMLDTHRLPCWRLLLAAFLATLGVWALFHPIGGEWTRGDTLTLVAAALFAFYIVELDRRSRRHGAVELVVAQCIDIGGLAALFALGATLLGHPQRFVVSPTSILVVAYLTFVCTALTFWLMTWAQARVTAVEAAIIYSLEPVIAAAFSIALGREPFAWKLPLGGSLVVAAMLVASTDPREPHPVAPPEGID